MSTLLIGDGSGYGTLLGFGLFFLCLAGAYVIFIYAKWFKSHVDLDEDYTTTEQTALDEFIKRTKPNIFEHAKLMKALEAKSFRKRLEEELVKDFFDEREASKKDKKTTT